MLSVWGIALIIVRFCDGYKYYMQSKKIKKLNTAKGHSRDFGNMALGIDVFILLYFIFQNFDWCMIISTSIIILFVLEYWITIYRYYPYRMRGCVNFKRPSIFLYFINSIISDKIRKHL